MRKIPFYRKIIFKVLMSISVILGISFVVSYTITTKYTDELINKHTSKEFSNALNTIESFISLIGQTAQVWARHTVIDNSLHTKLINKDFDKLKELIEHDKNEVSADSIILLDSSSRVLAQAGSTFYVGDTLESYDIVKETISSRSSVTRISREKESFIIYSSSIIEKDGEILGIMIIGYFINDILLANINISNELEMAFIGNSAIMSSTKWGGKKELDILPINYINYQYLLKNPNDFQTIKYKDEKFIVSAKNLNNIESSISGSILIGQSTKTIEQLKQEIFYKTLLLLGSIFSVTLIVLILFTNKLISSITVLKDSTQKIADGDLRNRVKIKTNDEFEILADNFNKMINSIEQKNKKLNDYNSQLEIEVEKRTKELIENEKILFEQTKMASMGEMIGNIAHQWRQPLNIISTAASSIRMKQEFGILEENDIQDTLHMIMNTTEHLSKTIDDFRNFSNESKEKSLFNISEVILNSIDLVLPRIHQKHITLIKNIEKDISLNGYKRELMQAIMNILNNSIDVLENINELPKLIFVEAYIKNNNVVISIKDNGKGINSEIINKVFEPYFTTKHQSRGTGLGLNMTYKIITENMNGSIKVENDIYYYDEIKYIGAKFILKIPIS